MDEKKTPKEKKKNKLIFNIILVIAIIVFLVSGFMLVKTFLEYKGAQDEYKDLASEYVKKDETTGKKIVDWKSLKEINNDVIGWIEFDNINISYPILWKAGDNDYYLSHTFKKEANKSGAVFVNGENAADFSDKNTIIYGHNMKDKSMFAQLNDYGNKEFFNQNPGFYIYDNKGCHYYKIFSVYRCNVNRKTEGFQGDISYQIKGFGNDAKFKAYADKVKSYSIYDTGVEVKGSDSCVMLSTCTENDNYRFVVHAVKAEDVDR